jgi:hypothetical protein
MEIIDSVNGALRWDLSKNEALFAIGFTEN